MRQGQVFFGKGDLGNVLEEAEREEAEATEPLAKKPAPAPPVKSPSTSKPPSPRNVVALAKARLRDVKKELRRMKALEKERDELTRLIAAAERKPKPVLREIKSTAG